MPRDGSQEYHAPFPDVVEGTTIESTVYNGFVNDIVIDLNTPRPVKYGGTGADNPATACFNLKAETATQVVSNYDSHLWLPGSFRSDTTPGRAAPVDGHAFAGVCYLNEPLADPPTNQNVVVEARDESDTVVPGRVYIREKKAGVWGAWIPAAPLAADIPFPPSGSIAGDSVLEAIQELDTEKVAKTGDTMTGFLTLNADPTAPMHAATKSYVDSTEKGRKNYIINGAMMVSQENGTNPGSTSGYYPADGFFLSFSQGGVISTQTIGATTPGGSNRRLYVGVATADTSVGGTDYVQIVHRIEGLKIVDLNVGTATAKTVTLQFGCKGPAGTYCVNIQNSAANRNYIAEYTISASEANIDVVKSITLPMDTAGTWVSDNTASLVICWVLMGGASYFGTAGVWAGSPLICTSNQFNLMGSTANNFSLFDVSLTEGSAAPPFGVTDYASELALCQRYYHKTTYTVSDIVTVLQAVTATNANGGLFRHPVTMRSAPSALPSAASNFSIQPPAGGNNALTSFVMVANPSGAHVSSAIGTSASHAAGQATALFANATGAWVSMNARL